MRILAPTLLGFMLLAGCGTPVKKSDGSPARPNRGSTNTVVTPSFTLTGKIFSVNSSARFVVVNFPLATLPRLYSHLSVYRNGLKVGDLRVSGPQYDNNSVADITAGQAQPGDDVRGDD